MTINSTKQLIGTFNFLYPIYVIKVRGKNPEYPLFFHIDKIIFKTIMVRKKIELLESLLGIDMSIIWGRVSYMIELGSLAIEDEDIAVTEKGCWYFYEKNDFEFGYIEQDVYLDGVSLEFIKNYKIGKKLKFDKIQRHQVLSDHNISEIVNELGGDYNLRRQYNISNGVFDLSPDANALTAEYIQVQLTMYKDANNQIHNTLIFPDGQETPFDIPKLDQYRAAWSYDSLHCIPYDEPNVKFVCDSKHQDGLVAYLSNQINLANFDSSVIRWGGGICPFVYISLDTFSDCKDKKSLLLLLNTGYITLHNNTHKYNMNIKSLDAAVKHYMAFSRSVETYKQQKGMIDIDFILAMNESNWREVFINSGYVDELEDIDIKSYIKPI